MRIWIGLLALLACGKEQPPPPAPAPAVAPRPAADAPDPCTSATATWIHFPAETDDEKLVPQYEAGGMLSQRDVFATCRDDQLAPVLAAAIAHLDDTRDIHVERQHHFETTSVRQEATYILRNLTGYDLGSFADRGGFDRRRDLVVYLTDPLDDWAAAVRWRAWWAAAKAQPAAEIAAARTGTPRHELELDAALRAELALKDEEVARIARVVPAIDAAQRRRREQLAAAAAARFRRLNSKVPKQCLDNPLLKECADVPVPALPPTPPPPPRTPQKLAQDQQKLTHMFQSDELLVGCLAKGATAHLVVSCAVSCTLEAPVLDRSFSATCLHTIAGYLEPDIELIDHFAIDVTRN